MLTESQQLQIDQAARGCISGTLSEWPSLADALLAAGVEGLSGDTHALKLQGICLRLTSAPTECRPLSPCCSSPMLDVRNKSICACCGRICANCCEGGRG